MHAQENAVPSAKVGKVMIVLDGSNSMWGQVDGEAKITIAKDVMTDLISNWDDAVDLGLMVYGHRRKGDCSDIEVVALPGKVNRPALIDKVQSISPRGKTPISKTLLLAATSVGYFSGKSSVVLVSDGLETCDADPCAQAKALGIINPGFDVHVIGFDVTEEEFKSLQCIATETGGKFFRANNAEELKDALRRTVATAPVVEPAPAIAAQPEPEPAPAPAAEPEPGFFLYAKLCEACERAKPLDVYWTVLKDGEPHYQGLGVLYPDDPEFEPGAYQVAARYLNSALLRDAEITIGDDGQQLGEVNLDGGGVSLYAFAGDDETLAPDRVLYRFYPVIDGVDATTELDVAIQGGDVTWLPAGTYKVVATHQTISETARIEIIAGEIVEYTFDMRFGNLQPVAVMTEGGKRTGHMTYRIYATEEAAIAGGMTGKGVTAGITNANFALKAGTYWVWARYSPSAASLVDRLFPVVVTANELSSPVFDMNVGVVDFEITSAGEDVGVFFVVRILEVNPDGSDGTQAGGSPNRADIAALPPGRYRFLRRLRDKRVVTEDFEIFAGQTTMFKATIN
ncbi:vWA domain-containing protein [Hoeflea phototrophica]|nr:VWA domain-containing protein [Hoeflea phototrophica]